MTLQEAQFRVEEIRKISGDDERAHSKQDDLRRDFIMHLAQNGNEIAAEILKTETIDFNRWCA